MREIPVSKFKANCAKVLTEVAKTRVPVRVTRNGKPLADVVPPAATPKKKIWLGSMRGSMEIVGDIVGPIRAFEDWDAIDR